MRRVLLASLFAAASVGLGLAGTLGLGGTAGADIAPTVSLNPVLSGVPIYSNVLLAFDFSDNSGPPTVSSGPSSVSQGPSPASAGAFNIIVDVFPESTGGYVRVVAVPPAAANESNLDCSFQAVQQAQVECAFNFDTPGVWKIHAQYETGLKLGVSSESITNLRVGS